MPNCLHGYTTKEEISTHFCESDESMTVCEGCNNLSYKDGLMQCKLADSSAEEVTQ